MKKFLVVGLILAAIAIGAYRAEADSTVQLFDRQQVQLSSSTATVNSATADYATWQPILTLAPTSGFAMQETIVCLDLAKASTGFAAVYTSGTITASVQRRVDGTNWRTANNLASTAVSGTNAAGMYLEFNLGLVEPTEGARVAIKISSVSNTNVVIPYSVKYRSGANATFTPAQ